MRPLQVLILCLGSSACTIRDPHVVVSVEDPDGVATGARFLDVIMERAPSAEDQNPRGEATRERRDVDASFPLTIVLYTRGDVVSWIATFEVRDLDESLLGSVETELQLIPGRTNAMAVQLSRSCVADESCIDLGEDFVCAFERCAAPSCGDAVVSFSAQEECDDGNQLDSDGCNAGCELEDGWQCSGAQCTPVCGDEVVMGSEECDDGPDASETCDLDCTRSECGDGFTNPLAGEQCDNGSFNSDTTADRCRTDCRLPSCGDGIVDGLFGETCDLGGAGMGTDPSQPQGACAQCRAQPGWQCVGNPSTCTPACNDGVFTPPYEECESSLHLFPDEPFDGCDQCRRVPIVIDRAPQGGAEFTGVKISLLDGTEAPVVLWLERALDESLGVWLSNDTLLEPGSGLVSEILCSNGRTSGACGVLPVGHGYAAVQGTQSAFFAGQPSGFAPGVYMVDATGVVTSLTSEIPYVMAVAVAEFFAADFFAAVAYRVDTPAEEVKLLYADSNGPTSAPVSLATPTVSGGVLVDADGDQGGAVVGWHDATGGTTVSWRGPGGSPISTDISVGAILSALAHLDFGAAIGLEVNGSEIVAHAISESGTQTHLVSSGAVVGTVAAAGCGGSAWVAWVAWNDGGLGEIRIASLSSDGVMAAPLTVGPTNGSSEGPAVHCDALGNASVAWVDATTGKIAVGGLFASGEDRGPLPWLP